MNTYLLPPDPRVVIFGLRSRITADEVRPLLGRWADADLEIEIVVVSEIADDAMAIVRLHEVYPEMAWRLAQRVDRRHHDGRRLRSWIPVMAWRR